MEVKIGEESEERGECPLYAIGRESNDMRALLTSLQTKEWKEQFLPSKWLNLIV